ncbi:MAG: type II toxin-antitoxin system RelB/DinJ family antitoxin [Patescibacteria group bacterium]|nr:type II toxin-antitoxin system RelB/DinJ family antitoxin [Patescibacteria group bacterium]
MSNGATIQLRVDPIVKNKAAKILADLGLDLSSAVKLFLTKVINTSSIPFEISKKGTYTASQIRMMMKETEEAEKNGKRYSSAKSMLDDILSR